MAMIYAHRGASAEQPENTLAAFRRAIERASDGIELDVHLSADGVPVVIHDETVDRTTNGSGMVADLTVFELKALDAGNGEYVPTLKEVLDLVQGQTHVNIEVKANAAADGVLRGALGRPTLQWGISSFDWDVLRYVRRHHAAIDLWPLTIGATDEALAIACEIGATQLNLLGAALDRDIIDYLKERRISSWVWTVNDPARAIELVTWGATGICTDNPASIFDALRGERGCSGGLEAGTSPGQ